MAWNLWQWLAGLLVAGGLWQGDTMRHGWYVNAGLKQTLPLQTGRQHFLVIPSELPGYALVAELHYFTTPCTAYRIARLHYARVHKAVYYLPTPTDNTAGPLAQVGYANPLDFASGVWTLRNYACNSSGRGYDFTPTAPAYGATHFTVGFCGRTDGGYFTVEQYVDAGGGSWSWQAVGSGDTIEAAVDTYNERTTFTLLQPLRSGSQIRVRWASGGWARLTWAAATWGATDAYPAAGDAVVWKETTDLLPLGDLEQALEPTQGVVVSGSQAYWGSYNHSTITHVPGVNGNCLLVSATHTLNIAGSTWTPAVGYFDDWRQLVMAGTLNHYTSAGVLTANIATAVETWEEIAAGVRFTARMNRAAGAAPASVKLKNVYPCAVYGPDETATIKANNAVAVERSNASDWAYPLAVASDRLAYVDMTSPSVPFLIRMAPYGYLWDNGVVPSGMRWSNVGCTGPASTMRMRLMLSPLAQEDLVSPGQAWQVGATLQFLRMTSDGARDLGVRRRWGGGLRPPSGRVW